MTYGSNFRVTSLSSYSEAAAQARARRISNVSFDTGGAKPAGHNVINSFPFLAWRKALSSADSAPVLCPLNEQWARIYYT